MLRRLRHLINVTPSARRVRCGHAGWAPVSFQHYQAGPQRVGCSALALPLAVNHLAGMSNDAPDATVAPLPAARDQKLRHMANALRALAMDAVEQAKSGHPGMPMGMADIATVLFTQFLRFDPLAPDWPDRDRFVLSNGHGSMLLYGLLHLTGYPDMTLDELKHFRQLGSRTAGHPERGHASGIETTTGPLGQGLANSVG